MSIDVRYDRESGVADVYGESMIFHCNHYNRSLQQTIEDVEELEPERMLAEAAKETVFLQLTRAWGQRPWLTPSERLAFASEMFAFAGFGRVDFSDVTRDGGTVRIPHSHYGLAVKLNLGERTRPAELFDRGYVLGALASVYGLDYAVEQPSSISMGDDFVALKLTATGDVTWPNGLEPNEMPPVAPAPGRTVTTTVDETAIVEALVGMPIQGDAQGLIPAFGVMLTRMYADYYNRISFRFERGLKTQLGDSDLARELLIEAGHICGFNTMGGIMKSTEWEGLVQPMIKNREDWMHGIVACINALGWGVWRVAELDPGKRMVMRVYRGYESLGHLRWFGKAEHSVDHLATGVSSALMNLLYHGDITKGPELDQAYYVKMFRDDNCFRGQQTKCLAAGDDYSEIVVEHK